MSSIPHKRCVTCGAEKPLSDYHKCKSKPDGLWVTCKACACERARVWRERNPDRDKEIQKGTRERRKAKGIKYEAPTIGVKFCPTCQTDKPVAEFYVNQNDPSGLRYRCAVCERAETKKCNDRNRERRRAMQRAWQAKNPRKKSVRYYELRRAAYRRYNQRYPEKRIERVMRRNARKRQTRVAPVSYRRIWERDQGFCYICGLKVDKHDCHYDHTVPLSQGGAHIESNIAVTHSWCNQRKGSKIVILEQERLL